MVHYGNGQFRQIKLINELLLFQYSGVNISMKKGIYQKIVRALEGVCSRVYCV